MTCKYELVKKPQLYLDECIIIFYEIRYIEYTYLFSLSCFNNKPLIKFTFVRCTLQLLRNSELR